MVHKRSLSGRSIEFVWNLRQAVGLRIVRIADEGSALPLRIAMFCPMRCPQPQAPKDRRRLRNWNQGPEKMLRVDFFAVQHDSIRRAHTMLRRSIEFVSIETKTDRTLWGRHSPAAWGSDRVRAASGAETAST
jgi:hypothetical protein